MFIWAYGIKTAPACRCRLIQILSGFFDDFSQSITPFIAVILLLTSLRFPDALDGLFQMLAGLELKVARQS